MYKENLLYCVFGVVLLSNTVEKRRCIACAREKLTIIGGAAAFFSDPPATFGSPLDCHGKCRHCKRTVICGTYNSAKIGAYLIKMSPMNTHQVLHTLQCTPYFARSTVKTHLIEGRHFIFLFFYFFDFF